MKNLKSLLALLLVAALCLMLLAACGSSASGTDSEEDTAAASSDAEETEEDDESDGEIVDITVTYLDLNAKQETADAMIDALNEITESKIGVHVNFEMFGMGDYANQVSLAMSGGEPIDIVGLTVIPGSDISSMHANGQLMDISEYLEQDYASGLMECVGQYLGAYTYDDGIFGVPAYRNYATNHYMVMRTDILEELGLTEQAENMTTWEEYEDILSAVYDAYNGTGLYPTSKGSTQQVMAMDDMLTDMTGKFTDGVYYDKLGDATNSIGATVDGDLVVLGETEQFVAKCEKLVEWMDNGWIYPDSAYDADNSGTDLIKSGVTFSYLTDSELGLESQILSQTGVECTCTFLTSKMLMTSTLTGWGAGIPVTSEEPEAAIKFLNLIYTDAEAMNVMTLGVEGTDYVVTDGVADYVDADPNTASWHGSDWLFGNQFLVYPFENSSDYRELCLAQTEALTSSPYLGFALDTSDLANTLAALTSVTDQYGYTLDCGGYTEDVYNSYVDALEAADVQGYLTEVGNQLTAWQG